MSEYVTDLTSHQEVVSKFGNWTAMSIDLADGTTTCEPAIDHRLKRLVQVAADTVRKPLAECRVLDLACLEGHYAIEFGMRGCDVVGIEIREANIAKASFAARNLGLANVTFHQDDVRNLSQGKYGVFDIIICSGILYHLQAEDVASLLKSMGACCSDILLLDTYVAVREDIVVSVAGVDYGGLIYKEHAEGASQATKLKDLWASIDNETSFWFHQPALIDMLHGAGFTTCAEVVCPTHPGVGFDRRMYVCKVGQREEVLSSRVTNEAEYCSPDLPDPNDLHPNQIKRGLAFKVMKAYLPQGLKDRIKPALRRIGLLDTTESPFDR